MRLGRLSDIERAEIWRLRADGLAAVNIGREIGRPGATVQWFLMSSGGVPPRARSRAADRLTLEEREKISRGLATGDALRVIARRLGRAA